MMLQAWRRDLLLMGGASALLGVSVVILAWGDGQGGTVVSGAGVAAAAGALAALKKRLIAAMTALGLLARAVMLGLADMQPVTIAALLLLVPPILTLVAAAARHRLSTPALPAWGWPLVLPVIAALIVCTRHLPPDSILWAMLLLALGTVATGAAFCAIRHCDREDGNEGMRYALGDRRWLTETARFLLLGRLSSGLSHELSQALNVITMANGNLGYILDRAEITDPHGTQLTERVRRIAANAEAAAQMLGQFRWFGQDGGREGGDLTVSSALHHAVAATRAAARKSGVAIEIRGDALPHSLPLRHGTIEMMATVALLEVIQMLAARPADSAPPQPIILEATRTATDIEISVICASAEARHLAQDDIAQATYELLIKLAASCRCELRRVSRRNSPVCFVLRLDRDVL